MLKNNRVLVVEDEPQIAEIIEWNLRLAGYEVTVVSDGIEAMIAFDQVRPDLVTIDLHVPSVSGFRLVEVFKRTAPTLPILVVTGLSFEEAEEVARSGADDFVTKPFEPQELLRKAQYHLARMAAPRPTPVENTPSRPPGFPPPKIAPSKAPGVQCFYATLRLRTCLSMHCPACGRENGIFSVRCHGCGRPLAAGRSGSPERRATQWSPFAILATLLGSASTVALIALILLISRQNLWPSLLASGVPEVTATPMALAPAGVAVATTLAVQTPSDKPRPMPSELGQLNPSGDWRVAFDEFHVSPDDTGNGWLQASVTCTIQNVGPGAASLDIPATVASPAVRPTPSQVPSFQSLPSVPENAPSVVNGLRLYLVDSEDRQFGGGFGAGNSGYDLIAAPGDLIRLSYRFRYPTSVAGPLVLRAKFPTSAGGKAFEVHLDRREAAAPTASQSGAIPRTRMGSPLVIGGAWEVTVEGAEFGPSGGPGERPVTVHLQARNLTDRDLPALTDVDDATGTLRDFYLIDITGHLAYSHMDDMPGVVIPAHQSRPIMVKLYTLDLASSSRPLYFSAILNWRANRYGQFEVDS